MLAIVLRRPPEQAKKIDERRSQKSSIAVSSNAHHRTVPAFRKLGPIRRNQQRQMSELRRRKTRSFENQDMLESVREMILPPNNVRNTQLRIVGARSQVISRHAIGAQQREILDIVGRFCLLSVDCVGKPNHPPASTRNSKAQGKRLSRRRAAITFCH